MGLDLDHVERRYLLAGAADASVAIYDTQAPTPADAAPSAPYGAAPGRGPGATLGATAAAAAAGTAEQHRALALVTKRSPGGHRFSVSCVAWYPVDTGLFVTGAPFFPNPLPLPALALLLSPPALALLLPPALPAAIQSRPRVRRPARPSARPAAPLSGCPSGRLL